MLEKFPLAVPRFFFYFLIRWWNVDSVLSFCHRVTRFQHLRKMNSRAFGELTGITYRVVCRVLNLCSEYQTLILVRGVAGVP